MLGNYFQQTTFSNAFFLGALRVKLHSMVDSEWWFLLTLFLLNIIQDYLYVIGPVKQTNLRKIVIIFLSISLNMCFGCSKELSPREGSFEYPQHMFWLTNKKNNFQLRTLIWGPECP